MKARAVDGTEAKAAAAAITIVPTVDGRHLFMIGRHSRCEIESREGSGCWVGGSIEEDVQRFDLRTRLVYSVATMHLERRKVEGREWLHQTMDRTDRWTDRSYCACVSSRQP